MGRKTWNVLVLLLAMFPMAFQKPLLDESMSTDVDTFITTGILLREVEDATVYTDEYQIIFALPDYPDLKLPPSNLQCGRKDSSYCSIYSDIMEINSETSKILDSASRMFTSDGVKESLAVPVTSTTYNEEEMRQPEVINAGVDWYKLAKTSLASRKSISNQVRGQGRHRREASTNEEQEDTPTVFKADDDNAQLTTNSTRQERSLGVLALGAKTLLFQAAKSFFFGQGGILKQLTHQRSLVPPVLKPLTNIAEFVSGLAQTITGASQTTNTLETDFEDSYRKIELVDRAGPKQMTHNAEFKYTQLAVTQNAILLQKLTNLHLIESAMVSCRAGLLPLEFVPQSVLNHRLQDLEKNLGADISLVFPSTESNVYYNKKLATCRYDDDGGVLGLNILLRPTKTSFQLYELKSFSYAWFNDTCDMGVAPGLIIRDTVSGSLYPVTDLDEVTCRKDDITVCKLPQEANADIPRQHCLMTIFGGGNAREVINACDFTCRKGSRISFTQVDKDSIVVAHLPMTGSKVKCDTQVFDVSHSFEVGALKVTLGCGCQLEVKNRVIGKSQRVVCDLPLAPFTIQHILPLHMTVVNRDWVPFNNGRLLETKFTSRDVLDESWAPSTSKLSSNSSTDEDGWFTLKFPIFVLPLNILCMFSMAVVLYKNELLKVQVGAVLAMSGLSTVDAARSDIVSCQIPSDIYWLLGTILFLHGLVLAYSLYELVMKKCRELHNNYVQTQVTRAIATASVNVNVD